MAHNQSGAPVCGITCELQGESVASRANCRIHIRLTPRHIQAPTHLGDVGGELLSSGVELSSLAESGKEWGHSRAYDFEADGIADGALHPEIEDRQTSVIMNRTS